MIALTHTVTTTLQYSSDAKLLASAKNLRPKLTYIKKFSSPYVNRINGKCCKQSLSSLGKEVEK